MNWYDKRYEDEEYKGHMIHVLVMQISAGADWVVKIEIQQPDGEWLPVIELHDHSFPQIEVAFATGKQTGREVIDRKAA